MKYFLQSAVIAIFSLFVLFSSAQQADYSGTWILNLAKSKLEDQSKDFTGSKFIISQKINDFKLTRYHFYGEKKNKLSFHMTADGDTRRIKLLFKGKLEWKENNLQATLWRKNFLNVVTYSFGAGRDELIADETFTGLPSDHHNIWVFDRYKE